MTQPKGRCRIDNEDEVEIVDLLDEVVGQKGRDFNPCDHQQPNLYLVAAFVRLVSPLDVAIDPEVKRECLNNHDCHENVLEDLGKQIKLDLFSRFWIDIPTVEHLSNQGVLIPEAHVTLHGSSLNVYVVPDLQCSHR